MSDLSNPRSSVILCDEDSNRLHRGLNVEPGGEMWKEGTKAAVAYRCPEHEIIKNCMISIPGWPINVATILHSDEALLATGA